MRRRADRVLVTGACFAAGLFAHGALADEVADFYKGRTVSVVVGHEVGTGFDIYGRALARHLGRHIPGNPAVLVQNMQGASGITSANWLTHIAPKDGTVLATFVQSVPFEPLFGNPAARFDPAKLTWIGNLEESIGICGVSKASRIERFDDLLVKESVFAGTGVGGPLARSSLAVKNLLGARIKLVQGYQGSASVKLAMQRGEVEGICGLPMSTVTSFWKDDYVTGAFRPIIQLSGRREPQLGGIPHVDDYVRSADDQQVFGLIFGVLALGRLYVSTPAVPPERANALRAAFLATAKDAAFLADAAKTQIDISPMTGEEVEAFIARVSASSPAVVARAKEAFRND